ncbi:MAG: 23S rRNA (adenine(1618)-N(6))-methyltransferase RlmF [Saprospiraceae bacterium]|nr:23S rRNA (adenine(1618)-N(6))-methyltransferase RlmF [Saprospiraceae bacterium]
MEKDKNKDVKPLHPRNKHLERYDLAALRQAFPELSDYVFVNKYGNETIDFSDPDGVKTLNKALLLHHYGIKNWEIPSIYLCPPIPGRADHIHYIADLLAGSNRGKIPRGSTVRVLDSGVGANCIYPLLGHAEYGWSFVGSELDPEAMGNAQKIITQNPGLKESIVIRKQNLPSRIYRGIIEEQDFFDVAICNPPFHASAEEAHEANSRKTKNLGTRETGKSERNFGGRPSELWTKGGEVGFIKTMIRESVQFQNQVLWFSSLVSKKTNVPILFHALKDVKPLDIRVIEMAQGQKTSRLLCWTFLSKAQHKVWTMARWK